MAKLLQVQFKKNKIIKLTEADMCFKSYSWNRLPRSNRLISFKDELKLEADRECLMDMKRAFSGG